MRELRTWERRLVQAVAIGFSGYFIYAIAVTAPFHVTRPAYLCLSFVLVFALYPATRRSPKDRISIVDYILCAATIGFTLFFFSQANYYAFKPGLLRTQDLVVGTVAVVLSIEACRRVLGLPLPILTLAAMAYVIWGYLLPGELGHRGFSYARLMGQMFSFDGIYGTVTGIYATYVLLFVIFGAIIQATGTGEFLIALSNALVGKVKGGTAKTAVVSSAVTGSIMGSGAANVAVTGTFTIPLMKKSGFPAHIAGAIETVSSSGGVLLPPIMGSAAFVLAAFTQTPYRDVALISFLPALLFYWGVYIQVHFMAGRLNIVTVDQGSESALALLKRGGHMLLPVVLVLALIFWGMTPYRAGLWAIAATIALHYIKPVTGKRLKITELISAFGDGAIMQLAVGASAGVIGIIIAALVLPGLPLKIASLAVALSQGSLAVLLFLMIIVSYVFGMGIPMVAAYVILAVIAAPALVEVGVPELHAHLIIMWFSLSALWTPPVAVGAFVASGIAGAPANAIGWSSVRLGIGLYIIPYLMAFGHILGGTLPEIIFAAISIAIGLYCFAAAIEGYTKRPLLPWERLAFTGLAVIALYPDVTLRSAAVAIFVLYQIVSNRDRIGWLARRA